MARFWSGVTTSVWATTKSRRRQQSYCATVGFTPAMSASSMPTAICKSPVGRRKSLVLAGGKKPAPAGIEALLRSIPLVGNALVVGERRSYLVALIALDPERAALVAKERGWPETVGALTRHRPFLHHL